MTDYKVPLTKILDIQPHPGADRLSIATVYGFQVITQKNKYNIGDKVVYIPVDSILPAELEATLFPEGSKVKLHRSRVRQIRLRGLASQGMLIDPTDLNNFENMSDYPNLEDDLAAELGITKYEPPQPGFANTIGKDKQRNKKQDHPLFHKYNSVNNIKWFPLMFQEGVDEVVIQEKLHGTNARAGKLPFVTNTFWKKVKKFLGLAPKSEQVYGSNNVDITARSGYKGFYGEDVYGAVFKKLDVFNKLKDNETVFGEIIGPSIQKNYNYGLSEHRFVLFDVKVLQPDGSQVWLIPDEVKVYAKERGFEMVPILYKGLYNKELAYSLTKGDSIYCPTQKVREGVVIKAVKDYCVDGNKRALKWINEEYLDKKDNSDYH